MQSASGGLPVARGTEPRRLAAFVHADMVGNGAVRIGETTSDAVPGRLLPLYELRLYPAG
jgi:hypothetical protein